MAVDVIIPAFNAGKTIGRAVSSALAQREVASVIVVDDCSTDDTPAVALAASNGDPRLHLARFSQNRGPAAARNHALSIARATFVAMVDSDDWLLPNRFEPLLKTAVNGDFVADNILFISEELAEEPLPEAMLAGIPDRHRKLDLAEFVDRNISQPGKKRSELGFLKPMFRREILESLELGYAENVRLGEDFVLYAKAMARGAKFILSQRCGYIAIERAGSLSGMHSTNDLEALHAASISLAQEPGLDSVEQRMLVAHAASIKRKLAHRRFLATKKTAGMRRAFSDLVGTPYSIVQIGADIMRDKLASRHPSEAPRVRLLLTDSDFQ